MWVTEMEPPSGDQAGKAGVNARLRVPSLVVLRRPVAPSWKKSELAGAELAGATATNSLASGLKDVKSTRFWLAGPLLRPSTVNQLEVAVRDRVRSFK